MMKVERNALPFNPYHITLEKREEVRALILACEYYIREGTVPKYAEALTKLRDSLEKQ